MTDQDSSRYRRLRYTATGALAALALAGAIVGTAALAAKPPANSRYHAAAANGGAKTPAKTPAPPMPAPGKAHTSQPGSDQPFLTAAQRLVTDGTISATEGQALDREIRGARIDTQTLASSGFTQTQLQAVQQALANVKLALARSAP